MIESELRVLHNAAVAGCIESEGKLIEQLIAFQRIGKQDFELRSRIIQAIVTRCNELQTKPVTGNICGYFKALAQNQKYWYYRTLYSQRERIKLYHQREVEDFPLTAMDISLSLTPDEFEVLSLRLCGNFKVVGSKHQYYKTLKSLMEKLNDLSGYGRCAG